MPCVFLVDRDKRLAKSVSKRLGPDYTVKAFTNPKQAVNAFIGEVPAVVVTELDLPGIRGLDMIREMLTYNTASAFIVFCALAAIDDFPALLHVGPDDVVDKDAPAALDTLAAAVAAAAARADTETRPNGLPRNRRSAELLRVLVDTLPSGLLVLDHDEHVVIWNATAERITTVATTAVRGRHRSKLPPVIHALLDPERTQIRHRHANGELHYIDKVTQTIRLESGRQNMVVLFSDATALVNAKLDMEQSMMQMAETKDLMEEQAARLAIALAEVEEKSSIIEEQNLRMVHELEMAGELQKSLLPDIYQIFNGVSFASKYISSIQIGGDLYDVVDLGQGLTGFLIADVSGHGVAAALVASMFKMSFHSHAANVASPKVLFHMLNDEIKPILSEDYITAFYLIVDRASNTITYSNAGHPTPLLYRRKTGEVLELDTNGFFIGMFEDGDYEERTTAIEEGDALLLYTDCILETENATGEQFGKERLTKLFAATINDRHGQEVIDRIEAEVRSFCSTETLNDDFTCILLEFTNLAAAPAGETPTEESHAGEFEEF